MPALDQIVATAEQQWHSQPRQAWEQLATTFALAEQRDNLRGQATAAFHLARAANQWVHPAHIQAAAQRAFDLCHQLGDEEGKALAQWQKYANPWLSDFGEAYEQLRHNLPRLSQTHYAPQVCLSFASACILTGCYDEAAKAIDQAEATFTAEQNTLGRGQCHFMRATSLRRQYRFAEALAAIEQARLLLAGYPIEQAKLNCTEGYVLWLGVSNYRGAAQKFQRAATQFTTAEMPVWQTTAYTGLAQVYQNQGHLHHAAEILRRTRAVAAELEATPSFIDTLLDSAAVARDMGTYQTCLDYAEQVLAQTPPTYARLAAQINQALANYHLGRYQLALHQLEQTQHSAQQENNLARVAECALDLGHIWHHLGQDDRAEQLTRQAADLIADQPTNYLHLYLLLNQTYFTPAEALPALLLAAEQAAEQKENLLYVARFAALRGEALVQQGQIEKGQTLLRHALEQLEQMGLDGDVQQLRIVLGHWQHAAGQHQEAQALWELASQTDDPHIAWQAHAQLALAERDPQTALGRFLRAFERLSAIRQTVWQTPLLQNYLADAYLVAQKGVAHAYAVGDATAALQLMELYKAQSVAAQLRQLPSPNPALNPALASERDSIAALEIELRQIQNLFQKRAKTADWMKLVRRYDDRQAQWERATYGQDSAATPSHRFELEPFRQRLNARYGDDWVAVDYFWLAETTSLGMVIITPTALQGELRPWPQWAALQRLVQQPERITPSHLAELGRALIPATLANYLQPETLLLIAPHAELHHIPWPALCVGEDEQPLVTCCVPLVAPSLHSFGQRPPATRSAQGVLLSCGTFANGQHAPLPAVAQEVANITHANGWAWHTLAEAGATWPALRELAHTAVWGQAQVWHMASHAFFNEQVNGRACGFALYDGDVWLEELRALAPLPPLVVLSACEGIPARIFPGDELVGLGIACLEAGAEQVVGSLWPVPDTAVPPFMAHFYTALAGQQPHAPLALATAQRAAYAQQRPLAEWAGWLLLHG